MDQMAACERVLSETSSRDVSHLESRVVFERKTRRGGIVLLVLAAALTILAVSLSVPVAGFAALMTVFIGGVWFSYRMLVARWARFRNLPITPLNRM